MAFIQRCLEICVLYSEDQTRDWFRDSLLIIRRIRDLLHCPMTTHIPIDRVCALHSYTTIIIINVVQSIFTNSSMSLNHVEFWLYNSHWKFINKKNPNHKHDYTIRSQILIYLQKHFNKYTVRMFSKLIFLSIVKRFRFYWFEEC